MNDHQIDDALRAALDVDHAPDFQARVRASVAAESTPPVWHTAWPAVARAGALAIGTAGLVVAIAMLRDTQVPERNDSSVTQVATAPAGPNRADAVVAPESAALPVADLNRPVSVTPRSAESPSLDALPLPDVIVSEDDGRSLVLIARHVQAGFALPPAPAAGEVALEPLPALSRIEVPPVTVIEPLVIARLAEGDSQ